MRILIFSILFVLLSLFALNAKAQYLESDPTPLQRIFYGGDIGLSFGSLTYISANPVVGYRITNRLSAGIGANYTYAKSSFYNYQGSMYGGNVFASFAVIKNLGKAIPMYEGSGILLYAEYNVMNISKYYDFPGTSFKYIDSPMLGPAFQTPIGTRSYALIMILFNFNESSMSPYPNPVIKASVQF
jgi:hypothetical protein